MRATMLRFLVAAAVTGLCACSDYQKDLLAPRSHPETATLPPGGACVLWYQCYTPAYVDVSAGDGATCAIHTLPPLSRIAQSNLYCWGDNTYGMLGTGFNSTTESCDNNF